MFDVVIEKINVVGIWYTYDQIIPTGMDTTSMTTYYLSLENQVLIPAAPQWLQEVSTSCMSLSGIWNPSGPQRQPDTTGVVVITPLQQIHIDNRGQPAWWSLMGLGWGCPIDCNEDDIYSQLSMPFVSLMKWPLVTPNCQFTCDDTPQPPKTWFSCSWNSHPL